MRFKINIGTFLNEESEMTKKMMGYDADDKKIPNYKYDDIGNQEQKEMNSRGSFLQNIVINPETSNWFKIWNFVRYAVLFYGYFLNMAYLAFYYEIDGTSTDTKASEVYESHQEQYIDIIMMIDIILRFITAYQVDQQYEYNLMMIAKNYL